MRSKKREEALDRIKDAIEEINAGYPHAARMDLFAALAILAGDPGRVWYDPPWTLYQWPLSKPIYFGGDEFLRKTLALHLPLLGRIVVAITKPGYFTEDGEERSK